MCVSTKCLLIRLCNVVQTKCVFSATHSTPSLHNHWLVAHHVTLNHDLSQRLLHKHTETFPHATFHTGERSTPAPENSLCSESPDKLIPIIFKRQWRRQQVIFIRHNAFCPEHCLFNLHRPPSALECSLFPAIYFWYCSIFSETDWYFHTGLVI